MGFDGFRHLATPAVVRAHNPHPTPAPVDTGQLIGLSATETRLVLPYPPSVNDVWRIFTPPKKCPHCGHGLTPKELAGARMVKTKVAREYADRVLEAVGNIKPLTGLVEVVGHVFRPRAVGDLDNTFKVLFDALKGLAFADDRQVVHIDFWRHDDKARPRVELEVRHVETDQGRLL